MRAHQVLLKAVFITALLTMVPLGIAQAQVTVTSATPSSALQGTTSLDVEIAGSGFDSSAQVDFLETGTTNPGGITVTKVVVRGSKKLIATIDVDDDATATDFDVQVTLSGGRKGKGITLFKVSAVTDPCLGAEPSFVFWDSGNFYLANESATCRRFLFTASSGSYNRYSSFHMESDGTARLVTTDGLDHLLLVRFAIGNDMRVEPSSVAIDHVFDPAQPGWIDVDFFDLWGDGRRLVYLTMDESEASNTFHGRLRIIDDIDACADSAPGCQYSAGTLLAESLGLETRMGAPRWSADGNWIYLEDYRGDGQRPVIARVPTQLQDPLGIGEDPELVLSGSELRLWELNNVGDDEVMVYIDRAGKGCWDLRAVKTATCSAGNCPEQVSSTSSRLLVSVFWGGIQSSNDSSLTFLAGGASENRRGACTVSGKIVRIVDSATEGVQTTGLTSGAGPAAR
jgi:uncharacterized protein with GYD domain